MASARKKLLLIPLAASFMLAGCAEPPQDVARKPDVVAQMVENSASICETGPVNGGKADYAARLRSVLGELRTAELDIFQVKGITVCLDQRLDMKNFSFWDLGKAPGGIFYSNAAGGGVITLRDSGKPPEEAVASFWRHDPRASDLSNFVYQIKTGDITPGAGNWHAHSYKSAKSTYTTRWTKDTRAGKEVQEKYPQLQLQQPPLATNARRMP